MGYKIYFDCCCLNRPYDDLITHTVRMEAEAVLSIVDNCESGEWSHVSSDILLDEILQITNLPKRDKVLILYHSANSHVELTDVIIARAKEFEQYNIKSYDALHLASAEASGADALLTTDKRFIKAAGRINLEIEVKNPLAWLSEVLYI